LGGADGPSRGGDIRGRGVDILIDCLNGQLFSPKRDLTAFIAASVRLFT